MRSKEQFKAYVYEKAENAGRIQRRNRIIAMRSIAAFSLCLIVAAVCVYASARNGLLAPKAEADAMQARAYDAVEECVAADGIDASAVYGMPQEIHLYSASSGTVTAVKDDAKNSACELGYTLVQNDAYIALLFDSCIVAEYAVEYFADEIVVKIIAAKDDAVTEGTAYSIPLENEKYNGQKITVIYE